MAALLLFLSPVKHRVAFSSLAAEGRGFEPLARLSAGAALAPRCNKPLCQPSDAPPRRSSRDAEEEGEGLEPPRPRAATPAFEAGALPVRLTLRFRSHRMSRTNCYRMMNRSCRTPLTPRPVCSGQDSNLHQRDSRSRASAGWATGAPVPFSSGRRRESNPHPPGANRLSSR